MKTLEKQQAVGLRNQGLSYREIQELLSVSGGSLSRWLRDIEMTQEQQERIHQKNAHIRQKFIDYNQQKRHDVLALKEECLRNAAREIGSIAKRELLLIGTALYWAEGCKGTFTSVVEFVNADPAMVQLIMQWFRICCQVPESKFRAKVQLHDVGRLEETQRFWSRLTGISVEQFTQPIKKLSSSSQGKRGNILPYGTIHIRIADVHLLTRIRGWVQGLGLAPSSSPA